MLRQPLSMQMGAFTRPVPAEVHPLEPTLAIPG